MAVSMLRSQRRRMMAPDSRDVCPECGSTHESDGLLCPATDCETVAYGLDSPAGSLQRPAAGPEIGRRLGPFVLLSLLGAGGFAAVYRAEDTRLGRAVAVKLLHASLATDDAFLRRFDVEARASARLRHRHIVTVYEVGQSEDGRPYLVMELLDGTPLSTLMPKLAPMPLDGAISVLAQLASALDYVHSQGLVHRDVKPSNVMLSDSGEVTLMDFGVARALDGGAELTQTGVLTGTPIYMAPEQIIHEDIGPAADIYALGVLAYELLAGRPPFTGSLTGVIHDHLETPPPPIALVNPSVPGTAAQAIEAALAKTPRERPATATEFVRLLAGEERVSQWRPEIPLGGFKPPGQWSTADSGSHRTRSSLAARGRRTAPAIRRIVLAAGALLVAVAVSLWLLLVGPLAGRDGRLAVHSVPAGATVMIDGQRLGVTPLTTGQLSAGTHTVEVEKPTYRGATREVVVEPRRTDAVNVALPSLAQPELLGFKNVFAALSEGADASGVCQVKAQITEVKAGQPFCMVVDVAPKYPGERDLSISYQFVLTDLGGAPLERSDSVTTTLGKGESQRRITWTYSFPADPISAEQTGVYLVSFRVDGSPVVSTKLALVR